MDMNSKFGKIMRVKYIEKERKVALSVKFQLTETSDREFNLNRDYDEPLSATFAKLYANYQKQVDSKVTKSSKKQKKDDTSPSSKLSANVSSLQVEDAKVECPIKLLDTTGAEVPLTTTNQDAWKEDFKLVLNNDQRFQVCVNLPHVKKLQLPGKMIAGMPVIVRMESDSVDDSVDRLSIFKWFYSKQNYETLVPKPAAEEAASQTPGKNKSKSPPAQPKINLDAVEWIPLAEGVDKRMLYLGEETESKLIKVICIPSDGKREGLATEHVATNKVETRIDLNRFPFTKRLQTCQERLEYPKIRVASYNILVKAFSEDPETYKKLYSYCPFKFIEYDYRRIMLYHEITQLNADIVFLQECEREFVALELSRGLSPHYSVSFETKHENKEGEAILFRSDRFKFIQSFNIVLKLELQSNPLYSKLWSRIEQNDEFLRVFKKKGTILQLIQVQRPDEPSHHLLLANTHLYYKGNADFVRLVQMIVSLRHIETVRLDLLTSPAISRVDIIFGGDFNSSPQSHAFKYAAENQISLSQLSKECRDLIQDYKMKELLHSLNLSAHVSYPFTHCIQGFQATLDYVFYQPESLALSKVVQVPSELLIKENVALPSEFFPSDHLPIIFEFMFRR